MVLGASADCLASCVSRWFLEASLGASDVEQQRYRLRNLLAASPRTNRKKSQSQCKTTLFLPVSAKESVSTACQVNHQDGDAEGLWAILEKHWTLASPCPNLSLTLGFHASLFFASFSGQLRPKTSPSDLWTLRPDGSCSTRIRGTNGSSSVIQEPPLQDAHEALACAKRSASLGNEKQRKRKRFGNAVPLD